MRHGHECGGHLRWFRRVIVLMVDVIGDDCVAGDTSTREVVEEFVDASQSS